MNEKVGGTFLYSLHHFAIGFLFAIHTEALVVASEFFWFEVVGQRFIQ